MPRSPPVPIGRGETAGLLVAYALVAGWGAEFLGAGDSPAPLIWPASGIGLALVLARGIRVWPLIFALAVPAALLSSYGGELSLAHAGGALLSGGAAALEPVLAAWLIWRMVGATYLDRAGPFLLATLIAAPVATFISAAPLVLGQLAGGLVTTHSWVGLMATWHTAAVSDWMGLLALAPPIMLWLRQPRLDLERRELAELLAFGAVSALVLAMPAPEQARYLLVAAHLAIAMRLPLKWAATAVAVTAVIYLSRSTLDLRAQPSAGAYLFFLREIVFAFTLSVVTYVTALLQHQAQEQRQRMESLARELSSAEHRERQRVAQILHDRLQQTLVAAGMAVARFRKGDASAADRADELIRDAIANARTLSTELHPPVLATLGLAGALRWLAEEAQSRHGLEVHVEADESADVEPPEVASFLLQATRELLLNVVKHSGSDHAWLRLRRAAGWLEVEVEDYGAGCDVDALAAALPGHYGMASIRQRTELLGGRFRLSTETGFRVRLSVPLDPDGAPPRGRPR